MELFKLFGTIALNGVDEAHSALDGITSKASGVGSKIASGVGTATKAVGTVAKAVGTAAVGAVAAATTAVTAIGKTAVESYAEYEQLIGGVETLYGDSIESVEEYAEKHGIALEQAAQMWERYQTRQQDVLDNAANAYKTAGMSVNEYMNTVNGFAASLTSSLGEYESLAASYADMIVTDMADNANKMGTDMSAIQNAYSGFAKQNYTMLDNLKLGYGGTQQEMQRLLRDAEELEGYMEGAFDISKFSDVAEAIHIIQENMGITGTTAKEAAKTISGSLASMKASWSNLVTGMARDDADIGELILQFTESLETVADNLLPRIEETIMGIGDAAVQIAPFLVDFISELVRDVAPDLIEAGAELADTLLTAFANSLIDTSPILAPIGEMILSVKDSISDVFDSLKENIDWESVFSGLQDTLEKVCGFITGMADGFAKFVDYATTEGTALNDLFVGIKDSVGGMVEKISDSLANIATMLVENINWDALFAGLEEAAEVACGLIEDIVGGIEDLVEYATTDGTPLNDLFGNIKESAKQVKDWFSENWGTVASDFEDVKTKIEDAGVKIIDSFNKILTEVNKDDGIKTALDEFYNGVLKPIVESFGSIASIGADTAQAIADVVAELVKAGKDEGGWLGKAVSWFKEDLAASFEVVQESIETVEKLLEGDLIGAFSAVKTIGKTVTDSLVSYWERVSTAISNAFTLVSNFFSMIPEKGLLGAAIDTVAELAVNTATGIAPAANAASEHFGGVSVGVAWDKAHPDGTIWGNEELDGNVDVKADDTAGSKPVIPAGKIEATANKIVEQVKSTAGTSIGAHSYNTDPTPLNGINNGREFYADGAVLTQPTAFGLNPHTGKTMVGGEAGAEAIAPIDVLQGYVAEAVEAKTGGMNDTLNRILDAIIVMSDNMGANMRDAMEGVSLRMNNRELARAVKGVV